MSSPNVVLVSSSPSATATKLSRIISAA
jgi:hypothetical protein